MGGAIFGASALRWVGLPTHGQNSLGADWQRSQMAGEGVVAVDLAGEWAGGTHHTR